MSPGVVLMARPIGCVHIAGVRGGFGKPGRVGALALALTSGCRGAPPAYEGDCWCCDGDSVKHDLAPLSRTTW